MAVPHVLHLLEKPEASQTQEPGTAAYAGDFGFKVLTSSDPAEKTKKLSLGRVFRRAFGRPLFQFSCALA